MAQPADDDTIRLTRPPPARSSPPRVPVWLIAVPAVAAVLAITGGWLLWRTQMEPADTPRSASVSSMPGPPPPTAKPEPESVAVETEPTPPVVLALAPAPLTPAPAIPEPPRVQSQPRDFKIEASSEQGILDHVPIAPAAPVVVFRFKPNPRILVLDFASLREQGRMFNRAAAFVEKAGLPHDRLLSEDELDAAVHANGDTVETYYYGHDYGVESLVRFFSAADRDNTKLMEEEGTLRHLIRQEGWFEPGSQAGLISIPQVGADAHVTRTARATILHHELSHGEYFTNPGYAAFVHRFWSQTLTAGERDHIRSHLRSLGYDWDLEDVMENEAQAYLMFTYSPDFFTPDMVGMGKGRLAELRNGFYKTMPAGWLRDSLGQYLNAKGATAAAHP
jgi:hypothetical protein